MPVVLDRLPLPNLTWYSGFSVLLLSCSVYYAGVQVTLNPHWKQKLLEKSNATGEEEEEEVVSLYHVSDQDGSSQERQMTPYLIPEVISFMFHEPLCIWTLINMAYCVLILLGTLIQRLVFGELRVSEQQHIKDKFWNFVFYKFIFVFGVMNVQAMDEVVLWCSWFSVLGFLHLLAQLCKDRFEYLSFSATTPCRTHVRLLGLLGIIFTIASFCLLICVVVGCHSGINTCAFMGAECILLVVRTLHVITRYCIYLWDITHEGLWEERGRYVYITELVYELSELVIDMVHHIHMLVWGNMFLTMASLVICMQLRLLFYQLQHKIKSHRNYLRVLQLVNMYPEVCGADILVEESTCAICWEHLESGRCLPCSHVFHASCLLAWLHQDLSCPTCRHKLHNPEQDDSRSLSTSLLDGFLPTSEESGIGQENGVGDVGRGGAGGFPSPAAPEGSPGTAGWRYVSWLPSFSVEQSHTQLPRHHQANSQPASTSQLDNLARQVQQMFPDVSYSHVLEDLRHTHSLEITIDNILEQRLVSPPPMFTSDDSPSIFYDVKQDKENKQQRMKEEDDVKEEEYFQDGQAVALSRQHVSTALDFLATTNTSEDSSDTESEGSGYGIGSCGAGCRFSKSPQEREQILAQRKTALLNQARNRFVTRSRIGSYKEDNSLAEDAECSRNS